MNNKVLTPTIKITLTALFIVLAMICQKLLAFNYVIPFLRISFAGPAVIIFASVFLGPWYGLAVGMFSDILGYFIFDPRNNTFFPQITLTYALLGFVSYFIFKFVMKYFDEDNTKIIYTTFLVMAVLCILLIVWLLPSLELYGNVYTLQIWEKALITVGLIALTSGLWVFTYLYSRKKERRFSVYKASFALLLIEVFVMVLFGTAMKGLAFGFSIYPVILLCQACVLFINIPLNTIFISVLTDILKSKKYDVPGI